MLLRNNEINQLIPDEFRNELHKLVLDLSKVDRKDPCGVLQKYANYKFANVTDEEINIKSLSGFPHISESQTLGIYESP